MKFTKIVVACSFIALSFSLLAQKKVIDHTAYPLWKRIGEVQLSPDGKYAAYTIRPMQGDGYLYVVQTETGKIDSIPRGIDAVFSGKSAFIAFRIQAGYDTLRKVELAKIPKDKWPKDSLGIYFYERDSLVKFPKLKEFKLAVESDLLVFSSQTNEWPTDYLSKKEKRKELKKITKNGPWKSDGKLVTIWQPGTTKVCHKNITGFEVSKNGQGAVLLEQQKFKKDSIRLIVFQAEKKEIWKSPRRFTEVNGVSFSENNFKITGLYATDTSEFKRWNLWLWNNNTLTLAIDTTQRFETKRTLSAQFKPRFHQMDNAILFGVWDKLEKPAKDTLLESEKYKLDIWHWQDKRLQPQQLVELKRDLAQVNQYTYNLSTGATTQLGRDSLSMYIDPTSKEQYVLASCDEQYQFETWKSPRPSNYYRLSLATGELVPLRNTTYFETSLSPSGNYFAYWDEQKNAYFITDLLTSTSNCVTCGVKANFLADGNGTPEMTSTLGIIGWTTDEKGLLLQAEKDIIAIDVKTSKAINFLRQIQAANDTNYRYTLTHLTRDSLYLNAENCLLTQTHVKTRYSTVYRLSGDLFAPKGIVLDAAAMEFLSLKRAKTGTSLIYQKQSNAAYPDAYVLSGNNNLRKISTTNPQQGLYNWSTVEQINWTSYKGIPLEGLIYKPENYDSTKSYPLLVYYYELHSDDIHTHYAPRPTASVIHPTEYASAGYFVFIPDIRYQIGHPANGAYDCIMSGTDAVLKKYPAINEKKMGLQGQSWGGYQTAQLITMTDRYAAAMAGAPVGNMISAYGGIRWGSGMSRQFQYEHTQSRIGKTIWEAPELYIENSPVFHLTTVKTPLLIMHNDQDGAVPWYQGIEIYTGLRRLQKPVWLLNYNGDDHNLMKIPNRIDLSIRMRQFFDYYLQDKPQPLWLSTGIPALQKGKITGY